MEVIASRPDVIAIRKKFEIRTTPCLFGPMTFSRLEVSTLRVVDPAVDPLVDPVPVLR